ncbi:MAG: hypothetical protein AAFX03_02650 [Pseudomonadota bacterium]
MAARDRSGVIGWARGRVEAFAEDLPLNVLITLLLGVSFTATLAGMLGFVSTAAGEAGPAPGVAAATIVLVFALTIAMFVALRETLRPRRWAHWPAAVLVYGALAFWSVGFGYGFWWSLLAGQETTAREVRAALETARSGVVDMSARLDTAAALMADASMLSEARARQEIEDGGTCGATSSPGPGPMSRARARSAEAIAGLARAVERDWREPSTEQLDRLGLRLSELGAEQSAGRRTFDAAYGAIRSDAEALSTSATSRGRALARNLRAEADALSAERESACFDPALAERLNAAADEIDHEFQIDTPDIRYSQGAEGVARAIEELWSASALLARSRAPPALQGRDLIALIAAVGVDLSLLVFTLFQPRRGGLRAIERRPRPADTAARDLIDLAQTAFHGHPGADPQRLTACFGAEGDARVLIVPQPPAAADRGETASALGLGAFAAALADLGELRPAKRRAWKAAAKSRPRLALAGWSPAALDALSTYQGRPAMMEIYLKAALSAAGGAPAPAVEAELIEASPPAVPALPFSAAPSQLAPPETVMRAMGSPTDDTLDEIVSHMSELLSETAEEPAAARAWRDRTDRLASAGIDLIWDKRTAFDPDLHEADDVRADDAPAGEILDIVRVGIKTDGVVRRKAGVILSAGDA